MKLKSLYLVFIVLSTFSLLVIADAMGGESFIPPVPDKSKTLPANDGGPDGCGSSRFDCVMGGDAVLDKQSGLIWSRNTYFYRSPIPWDEALKFCESVNIGGKQGWRLPTRDELITVLDTSQSTPALPEGHPFIVPTDFQVHEPAYWTSTDDEGNNKNAWIIAMNSGKVMDSNKLFDIHVWPVRDGE